MSLPRYGQYKDSGVAWLGEVPGHWEVKRLKHSLSLLTEKTDRRTNPVALENIESWSGRFIATETEFAGDGVAFMQGDVLFGKLRPYLAKVLLADSEGEAVGDFHVMRPNDAIAPRFAQYQLLNRTFIDIVDGSTFGSKMPRASWEFVSSMPLVIPPMAEQTAITAFLDRETAKIDALVAEQEKLIALLQEKRQAVISHAVTQGLNPHAPMKDSGVEWLGKVPGHWFIQPLKYAVKFHSGGTPDKLNRDYWDGEIHWASAKDLKVDDLFDTADHITQQALDDGAAALIGAGSVLVVVRGMILARIFPVVTARTPMAINQDLKAVIPNEHIHREFLPWLLRGTAAETLNRLDEAGHGTKALRMDAWASMQIPVPTLTEQANIATYLCNETAKLDTLVTQARTAITLLQERRTALISAAVTGQIDVRGWAKAA
jgi:type I restriction enzyme S subunit